MNSNIMEKSNPRFVHPLTDRTLIMLRWLVIANILTFTEVYVTQTKNLSVYSHSIEVEEMQL
jgi:hypothetical protein